MPDPAAPASDTPSRTVLVQIMIDVVPGPISGSLTYPEGGSRRFRGWMELTEALERIHAHALASAGDTGGGWSGDRAAG